MINECCAHKYCRDEISKIENYDKAIADTTQTWHLHHRLELTLDGEFALTAEQLKIHDMYYNRPYYELIFLTPAEHMRLHNKGDNNPLFGKHHSEETRNKMSEVAKGRTFSDETCKKISEAKKGKHHSEETRNKMSEALKGRHLSKEHRKKLSEAAKGRMSPMKGKHLSEESRRKISEAAKRRWAKR